ncbi:MAG: lipase family protein [bacterium]
MQHLAIVLSGLICLGGIAPPAPAQAADRPISTQSTPPKGVPADPRIPGKPAASTPAPTQRPPAPPALPAVRIPRSLAVFAADVYRAERGIDGALLLTDAQKAQIAGLTESIRAEDTRLNAALSKAATRDERIDAAKSLAKGRMQAQPKIRQLVAGVLTPEQKATASAIDGLWTSATAQVEQDFATRFNTVTGTARTELERAKPEMILATFLAALDARLTDAQKTEVARRSSEIGVELAQLAMDARAAAKAREIIARRAAARERAEAERVAAQSAGRNFGAFKAGATSHEWANAYMLAYVSNLVYPGEVGMTEDLDDAEEFEDRFATKLASLGIDRATVEMVTASDGIAIDAEAVVFTTTDAVIVVFRGSESSTAADLRDWVTNAAAVFHKLPSGSGYPDKSAVHTGMWNATSRIYRELKSTVDRAARGGRKVWITGHSLGGAMASLFAGRYIRDGGSVQGVVTFAAPRCANGAFGAFVTDRARSVQRWANKNDIVPMVPLDIDLEPFDGYDGANGVYRHFGRTASIRKNDTIDLSGEEVRCPNADYVTGDAGQHSMALYCQAIRREMPAATRELVPNAPGER